MPYKPSELDPVHTLLQQCLHIMRDLPPATLEQEKARTPVYHYISAACNAITDVTYVKTMAEVDAAVGRSSRPRYSPKSASPRGRGGVADSPNAVQMDLDAILGLKK